MSPMDIENTRKLEEAREEFLTQHKNTSTYITKLTLGSKKTSRLIKIRLAKFYQTFLRNTDNA